MALFNDMGRDLRHGLRMLARRPGFTAAAVATLALGIGANTSIFSVVNSVLLRPLPYDDPDRLVRIYESNPGRGWPEFSASLPNYIDLQERNRTLEPMAAWLNQAFNITGSDEPERIGGGAITPTLFPMLGVTPAIGRNFLPEEATPGAQRVVMMTYALWQRRFGADPAILGRSLTLNDESYTVVGVLPETLQWFEGRDLFVPLDLTSDPRRANHVLSAFGRLKTGVTLEQARSDMDNIARQLEQQYPESNAGWGVRMITFQDWLVEDDFRRALWVLTGAVGFVLLIACANVANLLLARAADRRREIAVRTALGAKRGRLIRQLLTECSLISLVGGAVGLLLAIWGVDLLRGLSPDSIPRLDEIRVDQRVLVYTLGLSLLASLLFGLAPVLQATRLETREALSEGGRGVEGSARLRLRNTLVVAEVALSVILLIGAALLIRSFWRLQSVEIGFASENLLTFQINLPGGKYESPAAAAGFYTQLFDRLRAVPGVQAISSSSILPFEGGNTSIDVTIEGRPPEPDGSSPSADWRLVTPDYFRAMGIPLMAGRPFEDREVQGTPRVAIISETMARRYWPDQDPIGKRFREGGSADAMEVVGVAGDVLNLALDSDPRAVIYLPAWQYSWNPMSVVVRAAGDPMTLVPSVRAAVSALDADLPVSRVSTMAERISGSVGPRRFNMLLLSIFSGVALALAAIGIYGVTAYAVSRRTHEIGVRMALGAQRRDVLRLILGHGSRLVLTGLAAGVMAAWGLSRLMTGLLFGVTASDPATYLAVPLVLSAVALLACYLPARRATKLDPMTALRYE